MSDLGLIKEPRLVCGVCGTLVKGSHLLPDHPATMAAHLDPDDEPCPASGTPFACGVVPVVAGTMGYRPGGVVRGR